MRRACLLRHASQGLLAAICADCCALCARTVCACASLGGELRASSARCAARVIVCMLSACLFVCALGLCRLALQGRLGDGEYRSCPAPPRAEFAQCRRQPAKLAGDRLADPTSAVLLLLALPCAVLGCRALSWAFSRSLVVLRCAVARLRRAAAATASKPTGYCLLRVACCLLLVARWSLLLAGCWLLVAGCWLLVAHCLLLAACCLVPVACVLLLLLKVPAQGSSLESPAAGAGAPSIRPAGQVAVARQWPARPRRQRQAEGGLRLCALAVWAICVRLRRLHLASALALFGELLRGCSSADAAGPLASAGSPLRRPPTIHPGSHAREQVGSSALKQGAESEEHPPGEARGGDVRPFGRRCQ
jgi:hypothetical protein